MTPSPFPGVFAAAALAALALACRPGNGGGGGGGDAAGAGVRVETAVVREGPFIEYVSALGTVSPRPGRYAELGAPAPTRVARIVAAAGQAVHEGDTLIVFERASFDAAAHTAEAALVSAQHAADRATRLVAAGVLPKKEADQAAQALAEAEAAAITARRNQELAALRAPLSGVVTRMTAVLGAPVDATLPLVAVVDPEAVDVVLLLTPGQAAVVRRGAAVVLRSGEGTGGEALGGGSISDVAAAVDSGTRGVPARVRVVRASRTLRLGETVFCRVVLATRPHAIVVPAAALVPAGEGFQVFVVDSAGIAHTRPVTVGGRSDDSVEITTGLSAGEVVITAGAYGVADSARVAPAKP